ncbi:MAG: type II CRISPR RNA-guided endonuclease Cas9 [Bacilli bacterium]|jgi:CRISPR-associated endonuclease Csn1|nr:type II CRISPR RNA-guided endonuclease Cas9 [Bacilli bacterium]
MDQKKYFLGLDIGTDSVGWCVTDRDYHVIRKQGKHLWGARLFGEASPAADRRMNRSNRRRLARRRWRVVLLQGLFNDAMQKLDPNFFDRLNNSALHQEDKPDTCKDPYLLFNGKELNDASFYKKYPTIYHLRLEMLQHPEKQYDLREIYLVMAHMIKYRGNFLYEMGTKSIGSDTATLIQAFQTLDDCFKAEATPEDSDESADPVDCFNCDEDRAKRLMEVFKTLTKRQELLEQESQIFAYKPGKDLRSSLLKLINGSSSKLSGLFDDLPDEATGDIKIDFTGDDFDDTVAPTLANAIGDNRAQMILTAKKIYDYRILVNLLKGKPSLSEAMVAIYDTHKDQLKELKELYKEYAPTRYNDFFRKIKDKDGKEIKNYANYVGFNKVGKKEESVKHSTSAEDLYGVIRKDLPFDKVNNAAFAWKHPDDKQKLLDIGAAMDGNTFLPRQNSRVNGVFPYQLNETELIQIIDNQKAYYPFLAECSKEKPKEYKIVSILKFRIPYYVGPLSQDPAEEGKESNKWAVRKVSDVKITPWNFDDVIDKEKTEQAFIERMKNSCTYLYGEETLPKFSLLYSEFVFLNEVNNWLINGEKITPEDKKYLMENVYLRIKKVSASAIKAALKEKYKADVALVTRNGVAVDDPDLHASLASYIDMANPKGFGPDFYKDEKKKALAEEIIYTITMFEDKSVIADRLKRYDLTADQKRYFVNLPYSGWGKMSRMLLEGIHQELVDQTTGETRDYSIMDLLRQTPQNFMEIYETNKAYDFKKQVEAKNETQDLSLDEIIDDEYASPDMKRALRQTVRVVEELKKILHISSFDRYFVECTRKPDEKKQRTNSRKKQLLDAYHAAKSFVNEEVAEKLANQTDESLRSKKMFLYFMQLGRSVYTGEPIILENLDKGYDIDHIIPQAKVKDDSFTNTVLVERGLNNKKQDDYPIPEGIMSEEGRKFVKVLNGIKGPDKTKGSYLMPKEKMERLLRTPARPLTEEEEVGFVNRQLTMTDQAVKATCDVLKQIDKDATIVYSKAGLVSDFRASFGLTKCRDINDFHHANDAYLNIVVGNVYNKIFSSCFTKEIWEERKAYYEGMKIDANHLFWRDQYILGTNTCVWKAPKSHYDDQGNRIEEDTPDSSLALVRKYMSLNDPIVAKMQYTQPGFFKTTILPAGGNSQIPLKENQPFGADNWGEKYGGYTSITSPYYFLVRSTGKKDKKIYSLETIPAYQLAQKKTDAEKEKLKLTYAAGKLNLKDPVIILPRLLIGTVVEIPSKMPDGKTGYCRLRISGRSGSSLLNANYSELAVSKEYQTYCKSISKVLGTNLQANQTKDLTKYEGSQDSIIEGKAVITKEGNLKLFDYFTDVVFKKPCFACIPEISSTLRVIPTKKTIFVSLPTIDQIRVLHGIISLLACKSISVDLSLLGLSKELGKIRFNKFLIPGTKIITQSVTGFYETVLFTVPED